MDATAVVAVVTSATTAALGIGNLVLTYKLKTADQSFARSIDAEKRAYEEQQRKQALREAIYEEVCKHYNVTMRRMRIDGARRTFQVTDPSELARLATEATRLRMYGSPAVAKAFDETGKVYRSWSDADDGTLSPDQQAAHHASCYEALRSLEAAINADLFPA